MKTSTYYKRQREDKRESEALARPGAKCWSRTISGVADYLHAERYTEAGEP